MADRELDELAKYLSHVATIDDMETLNHKVFIQSQGVLASHLTGLSGLETCCPCTASPLMVPVSLLLYPILFRTLVILGDQSIHSLPTLCVITLMFDTTFRFKTCSKESRQESNVPLLILLNF